MISGIEQLRTVSRFLRSVGALVRGEGVRRAADAVGRVAAKQYDAGQDPFGKLWSRNKDGSLSLRRPVKTIRFWGVGGVIRARAEDVLRYHMGPAKNRPGRPVFPPNNQLPPPWLKAADDALKATVDENTPRL